MSLEDETEKAIKAADHLTEADVGAVEAMRQLARKIDSWDELVATALRLAAAGDSDVKIPPHDNVSLSTYLKYADALGLSPHGRKLLGLKKRDDGDKRAKLTALRGGSAVPAKAPTRAAPKPRRAHGAEDLHPAAAGADAGNEPRVQPDRVRRGRPRAEDAPMAEVARRPRARAQA